MARLPKLPAFKEKWVVIVAATIFLHGNISPSGSEDIARRILAALPIARPRRKGAGK